MQLFCTYNDVDVQTAAAPRRGLTLIELVVVLAILVALSGMVIPLISGLGHQTNASTNATLAGEVDRAVKAYHARGNEQNLYPDYWDSLLDTGGALFGGLHPALSGADPTAYGPALIEPLTLSEAQAESLTSAGIYHLHVADESSSVAPSLNQSTTIVTVTTGAKVAGLDKNPGASTYEKLRFGTDIVPLVGEAANEFVVFGVGLGSQLRGQTIVDVPLVQSADPTHHYARVLCVFMIPSSLTDATSFPAKYVGCFLPDGTSLRNNLDKYNNAAVAN